MLNKMILVGRLTSDPDLRYTDSGAAVCNIRLASTYRKRKGETEDVEDVLYITAIIWKKRAENCAKYLKKGDPVFVTGRLKTRSWVDKITGDNRNKIEMLIEEIQFINRTKSGTSADTEKTLDK